MSVVHKTKASTIRTACGRLRVPEKDHHTFFWSHTTCPECLKHRPVVHWLPNTYGTSICGKNWSTIDPKQTELHDKSKVTCPRCLAQMPKDLTNERKEGDDMQPMNDAVQPSPESSAASRGDTLGERISFLIGSKVYNTGGEFHNLHAAIKSLIGSEVKKAVTDWRNMADELYDAHNQDLTCEEWNLLFAKYEHQRKDK